MQKLGDIFKNIDNRSIKKRFLNAEAIAAWDKVVGEAIRENAIPVRIRNGILYVKTTSSAWAQELKALELNIRKKINNYLGEEIVKEVRFLNNYYKKINEKTNYENKNSYDQIELSSDEYTHVEDMIKNSPDEIKDILKKIILKDKKLKSLRKIQL